MGERGEIDPLAVLVTVIRIYAAKRTCSQQDIADALGVSKAGVRYRIHQLDALGCIVNERNRLRPAYPLLDELGVVRLLVRASATGGISAQVMATEPGPDAIPAIRPGPGKASVGEGNGAREQ